MNKKSLIKLLILLFAVPLTVILGLIIFNDRGYSFVAICVAGFSLIPILLTFEKKENNTTRLVILSVMIALSVAGRFIFAFVPFFKPVTAIVVITGMYMGYECGFICGAFTALISNFMFGQGPWTPFQMFSWGLIGLGAGILGKYMIKSRLLLLIYGIFSGVLFSLIMDVWSTMWLDGTFNIIRFYANAITALPVTAVYVFSNVVFLLVLGKPFGKKINRIKTKYGI